MLRKKYIIQCLKVFMLTCLSVLSIVWTTESNAKIIQRQQIIYKIDQANRYKPGRINRAVIPRLDRASQRLLVRAWNKCVARKNQAVALLLIYNINTGRFSLAPVTPRNKNYCNLDPKQQIRRGTPNQLLRLQQPLVSWYKQNNQGRLTAHATFVFKTLNKNRYKIRSLRLSDLLKYGGGSIIITPNRLKNTILVQLKPKSASLNAVPLLLYSAGIRNGDRLTPRMIRRLNRRYTHQDAIAPQSDMVRIKNAIKHFMRHSSKNGTLLKTSYGATLIPFPK